MLLGFVKRNIKLAILKKKWRKCNKHNFTRINSIVDFSVIKIGNNTYGTINVLSNGNNAKVLIGNYCSISDNVVFLINNDHPTDLISTYPFKKMLLKGDNEAISKGDIIIGDDVWIGFSSIILSGVSVGQGAIIAAGSVVTKDIPPYAIVGGVPARIIKYRFEPQTIESLCRIDYSKIDISLVQKNIDKIYLPVTELDEFSWLPTKR